MNFSKKVTVTTLMAALLIATVAIGGVWFENRNVQGANITQPATEPATASTSASTAVAMNLPDFSSLVEKYGPAVVNITVTGHERANTALKGLPFGPGFGTDNPFNQFFRGFQFSTPRDIPIRGEGSGFIVRADGIVLTNAHVVDNAQQVTVKLTDKREFTAKVLGSDKQSDVAVLKIDAKNLPTVQLGHDTNLKVGQWVVAIGAPFGFDNSVTAGIVSAKQRELPHSGYVPFIQTDVPINPGNSGGPLFNLNGQVVGINSQIYSRSGGYQGLSFAIPIDIAMNVGQQIETHGHVAHGKLGVSIQEVNQALAETFGLDKPRGALVSSVDESGPAGHAGLKAGDVILNVDGKPVTQSSDLPVLIAEREPGSTAHIEVWRNRGKQSFSVKLADMNGEKVALQSNGSEEHGKLGIAVRPLTAEERKLANAKSGLLVEDSNGAAADSGIQPGDIVLAANGKEVKNVAELRHIVDTSGHHIALLVQRGDTRIFVPVALG